MTFTRIRTGVDLTASVLTILVCLAATAHMWRSWSASGAKSPPPLFVVGERLVDIPQGYCPSDKPLVVVSLRSTCGYCTESMPSLRKLWSRLEGRNLATLIAVSPETEESLTWYLASHSVRVHGVRRVSEQSRLARYAPHVALLDRGCRFAKSWVGVVDEGVVKDVQSSLEALIR